MKELNFTDGKPQLVDIDPMKEIQDEIKGPDEVNAADDAKSALYADMPKAKVKMDRSINARRLAFAVESYKRFREAALPNFSKITGFEDSSITYITKGWEFKWDKVAGTLKTLKKPDNAYNLEFRSSKLKTQFKIVPEVEKFVENMIKEHMRRIKN